MNVKAILLATLALGLVVVPLVAAAPIIAQNGDTLKLQDQQQDQTQLQTRDCTATAAGDCLQTQDRLRTQDQQQLQTQDCNGTGTCNGDCNQTQLQNQTRLQQCTGSPLTDGYAYQEQNRYCHCNQQETQQRPNQAP